MRSIKVLIAGLAIVAFGIAVLLSNGAERAEKVADELVQASAVSPENEGKLVIVSGTPELVNGGVIVDEEAGLRVENAIHYSRVPYQQVYALEKREVVVDRGEDKLSKDDDKTKTEYYVVRTWINADQKRDAVISATSGQYENPPAIPLSAYHASGDLRLSGFQISSSDVFDYIHTKIAGFTKEELNEACGSYITRSEIGLRAVTDEDGDGVLSSGDEIGDVHVLFSYETLEGADPVTLIGRQRGDKVVFEDDDPISDSEHVQPGVVSKEEFVDLITAEDASSRRIGIIAVVIGAIVLLLSLDWRAIIGN